MPERPDYYKILGVGQERLRRRDQEGLPEARAPVHPDRNAGDKRAEERFKEISQANDVLSDAEKRKAYDRGTGPFGFGMPGGFDSSSFGGGFSDILSNLFGGSGGAGRGAVGVRGPRAPEARGRDLETEVLAELRRGGQGRPGAAGRTHLAAVPDLPRDRCQAGHQPEGLPGLQRTRNRGPEPGDLLDLAAVLELRRLRDRESRIRARRATARALSAASGGCASTCPPASATAAGSCLPARASPGLRGTPPGDLYVITRVSESPVFKWSGENLEVEVPLTIPEAIRGAVVEVPTLTGTKRCGCRAAPSTGPFSGCGARAPHG